MFPLGVTMPPVASLRRLLVHFLHAGTAANLLLALFALLIGPAAAEAQEGEGRQRAVVRGFVTDASSGQILPGANAALIAGLGAGDSLRVVRGAGADADGFYQIASVAPGRYLLRVSYVGYEAAVDTLRLGDQRIVQRNVALAPAGEELEEVVVEQEGGPAKVEAGLQRIRPADLDRIPTPGPTGDLAGYLQTLPGVVSLGDRGGQLYIRGGAPSQNQVLMDKMLLYRPFHIVGFFSAFPQDLISGVDFYAGGFPARYSDRISSVIDVTMRKGNEKEYGGAVSLSPFLNGVQAEGPIREGRTSLLVSVRQSAIEQTAPPILGEEQPLTFGEQFFKLQNTSDTGQCSLTGLHTYDRGQIDPERNDVFKWQNYGLGGRCLALSPRSPLTVEADFGVSRFSNEVGGGTDSDEQVDDRRASSIWNLYTNVDLSRPAGRSEVRGGFRVRARSVNYSLNERYQSIESREDFFISVGGYGGVTVPLGDDLEISPGIALRAPLSYGLTVQPRLRAQWRPFGSDAQTLNAAAGLYQQILTGVSDERDAGSVFTVWTPAPFEAGENVRPQAIHALLGWQQRLARGVSLSVEGYYKRLADQIVPIWDTNARFTTTFEEATGNVYGLDARATYDREPFYLYLGYGLSWTRYGLGQEEFGRWFGSPVQEYHPPHDQRHSLNAVASYQSGPWQVNARWQYGSGRPYTPPIGFGAYFDLRELPDVRGQIGTPRFLFERPYGGRLPAYHRLDVSLERRFDLDFADLTLEAGAINAYDRANLFYYDLFRQRRVDQLPVVPYLSLKLDTLP